MLFLMSSLVAPNSCSNFFSLKLAIVESNSCMLPLPSAHSLSSPSGFHDLMAAKGRPLGGSIYI